MTKQVRLQAKLLNARLYRYFIYAYLVFGVGFIALLAWYFETGVVILPSALILGLSPLLLKRHFRRPFIKECVVEFDRYKITIEILDDNLQNIVHHYDSIESYQITDGINESYLGIFTQDGGHVNYNFDVQEIGTSNCVITTFVGFIRDYNIHNEKQKIKIKPTFLVTIFGTIILTILGGGWFALLVYLFTLNPKTLPIGILGGIGFFLQILALRKREMKAIKDQS